jgi:hypothetical protein
MLGEYFLTFLKGPHYHHHQGQAVQPEVPLTLTLDRSTLMMKAQ